MNLYARVTDDGYMLYAAKEGEYTGSDRYWADYFYGFADDAIPKGTLETIFLVGVPESLANDLCEQGTCGQSFSDGYEAWQAAMKYVK